MALGGLSEGADGGQKVLRADDGYMDVVNRVGVVGGDRKVVDQDAWFDMAGSHGKDPWTKEKGERRHGEGAVLWDRIGTSIRLA